MQTMANTLQDCDKKPHCKEVNDDEEEGDDKKGDLEAVKKGEG